MVDFIYQEAINKMPNETGGILLGYIVGHTEYVVTKVVGPGPNATHGSSFFIPDTHFHNKEVERIYVESGFTETYLGDWHTHPNSTPYLSDQDKRTLKNIAHFGPARINSPIMLVAAYPLKEIKLWVYQKRIVKNIVEIQTVYY